MFMLELFQFMEKLCVQHSFEKMKRNYVFSLKTFSSFLQAQFEKDGIKYLNLFCQVKMAT